MYMEHIHVYIDVVAPLHGLLQIRVPYNNTSNNNNTYNSNNNTATTTYIPQTNNYSNNTTNTNNTNDYVSAALGKVNKTLKQTSLHNKSNNDKNRNNSNTNSGNQAGIDTPMCQCNVPSVQFTVSKDGPNKGKLFYTCKTKACKYFQWLDLLQ